jgi:anti-sigma factor RsiW
MSGKDEPNPMPSFSRICPSTELSDKDLERYLLGRIQDPAELTQVEQHLAGCRACAERAEAMTASIAALIRAVQRLEREDGCESH